MLSQQEILHELTKKLQILQRNYGVKRIGLFGSYSRDDQTNESDIDILVDFKEEFVTFDNYMELKFLLEDHFQKTVDLIILDDIKPALKPGILRSIKYAEGA